MPARLKTGVKLAGIRPELVLAFVIAKDLHPVDGAAIVITSALDGKHSRGSKHYVGQAIDLRTRDITKEQSEAWRNSVALALGSEYDVVLERDHLHIEFDPKE